jgi:hypothetical protein
MAAGQQAQDITRRSILLIGKHMDRFNANAN